MNIRNILDLFLVFILYASLKPLCVFLIKRFDAHTTAVYGIAAILTSILFLTKEGGIVRDGLELVLVVYFMYIWWLERKLSKRFGDNSLDNKNR